MAKALLFVFLGGGLGSVLRYLVAVYTSSFTTAYPLGTFIVNVIGSLLIGIIIATTLKNGNQYNELYLFVAIGVCGGFTTFSSFALENYNFLKSGELGMFSLYSLVSFICSVLAVFVGVWFTRLVS